MCRYAATYGAWITDPNAFWLDAARAITWLRAPTIAQEPANPGRANWFPDGRINACHAALDAHVEAGRGDHVALYYDSPVTQSQAAITYTELLDTVAAFAGGLGQRGVGPGGRVLIYMPMIPEAVVAMLATARLGAVHSVVFGGFAAPELAKRIDDFKPDVIVTASCGIEPSRVVPYEPLLNDALSIAEHAPRAVVVKQRPQLPATLIAGRDVLFEDVLKSPPAPCAERASTDPLYVLYTSGTTGAPKGVVRDIGGYLTALAWSMAHIYGVRPGETFWAASDIGWVVGHSYIVYAPLVFGCASVLYEGKPVGTPDAGAFWRVIDAYNVTVFFTAPTALRAIKRVDPDTDHLRAEQLSRLRTIFLAGERADPDTVTWAGEATGKPIIDHWWQTELGWPALSGFAGLDDIAIRIGAAGRPVPGYRFAVLDADGTALPAGESGAIAIETPLPPGCMTGLWNAPGRYEQQYLNDFAGYYATGDAGFIDAEGFVHVMGRTDDIINVAGHRLSTGSIEEAISSHPDVAECAVVGAADDLKGQTPVAFVVLKAGADGADIEAALIKRVRDIVGPVAAFKRAYVVERLPKTRSGKILRKSLRGITDRVDTPTPATIDDPSILTEITSVVRAGEG